MVNSIYCGNPKDSVAPGWREVAALADGHYAAIDHNNGTITITTPFDDELAALSGAINETYIAYTSKGRAAKENQTQQDDNAAAMNSSAVASRAQTKGGSMYRNGWDLVEASQQEDFNLEEIKDEDLPEEMRGLTLQERQAYIEQKAARRAEIQAQIAELGGQRKAYISEQMRKQSLDGSRSFGEVMRAAVREQANQKGFSFPEPTEDDVPSPEPEAEEESPESPEAGR